MLLDVGRSDSPGPALPELNCGSRGSLLNCRTATPASARGAYLVCTSVFDAGTQSSSGLPTRTLSFPN
jgi:hypothetical protein